ncbi:MAG: alpha/beta hydrolase [Gemmataceae bacterium]
MLISTDVGNGPVVVLLHAFPLDRRMWLSQIELLADMNRVIAPDLPGFGDSPLLTNPSIDAFADQLAEHLTSKEIHEPVTLVGLSMGGYVSLAFARRHPQRLAALVLADTKAEADDAVARANREKLMATAANAGAGAIIAAMLPKLLGATTQQHRPEVVAATHKLGSDQRSEAIVAALKALRDRPDATPSLGQINVPTLVIVGEEDVLTPPSVAQQMAQAIPRARLAIIPQAGHLAHAENPTAFNEALLTFLTGVG